MADGAFGILIQNMNRLGFFQFLFPFLLALAIVYGLLKFSMKDKLPNSAMGVISLIIAFFVMLYSSWNVMIVSFFANLSGMWLVVATGILFIIILLALTGKTPEDLMGDSKAKWVIVLVLVFIGILIFFGAGGAWLVDIPTGVITSDFWTILFFIVILAIVVFWLGSEGGGKAAPSGGGETKK
jgi:hypothetical protein